MNHTFRSAAVLIAGASIAWLPTAISWGAGPAVPHPGPFSSETFSPAGEYCAFALDITITSAAQIRPSAPGGGLIATGSAAVEVTNLQNSQTRTYNISGPTFVDGQTGQLILTGNALVGQPSSIVPDNPFLVITRGRWAFDANGIVASGHGAIGHDVCAELS